MGQESTSATVVRLTRVLLAGALVSLCLLVLVVVVAAVELARVERMVLELAVRSQRSAFSTGEVAEQLARLRANVGSAVRAPPERTEVFATRVDGIVALLHSEMRHLPQSLHPEQDRQWFGIEPKLESAARSLIRALALARSGKHDAAVALLDERADSYTEVHEALDKLSRENEGILQRDIEHARRRAGRIRLLEGALAGLLFLGTAVIWVAVSRAIRTQARLLAEYMRRVETANADLDAFAGRVAHDLKNALTPLAMAPGLLRQSGNESERVLTVATRIEHASAKAIRMIDGLLAFSRAAQAGDLTESAAVRDVLDEVLEELAPLASRFDVSLETAVEDDLHAQCSAGLLHIVIANLCNNAVKFIDGRPARRVRISARSRDGWCILEVEDTGPGIPAALREKIFEPFYRIPGEQAAGSGLGLATVRRIVEARGGAVAVHSVAGGGSRFEVRLQKAERP